MWFITIISAWLIFNAQVVLHHIKKLTEDNNRPSYTPFYDEYLFALIFIFGIFMYLYLNKIRRYRYIKYLEKRLELLNTGNYGNKNEQEIINIKRILKLNKLQNNSKRFKICG